MSSRPKRKRNLLFQKLKFKDFATLPKKSRSRVNHSLCDAHELSPSVTEISHSPSSILDALTPDLHSVVPNFTLLPSSVSGTTTLHTPESSDCEFAASASEEQMESVFPPSRQQSGRSSANNAQDVADNLYPSIEKSHLPLYSSVTDDMNADMPSTSAEQILDPAATLPPSSLSRTTVHSFELCDCEIAETIGNQDAEERTESFSIPSSQYNLLDSSLPKPLYICIENARDPVLQIILPVKVMRRSTQYAARENARGAGSWGILSADRFHLCRFCGVSLAPRDPSLSILGHLLGRRCYRKNSRLNVAQDSYIPCSFAPSVARRRAQLDLEKLISPKQKPAIIRIELASTQPIKVPASASSASVKLNISANCILGDTANLIDKGNGLSCSKIFDIFAL